MDVIPPPEGLLRRLHTGRRFLITSHASPDGDAIGSALGLSRVLADSGRQSLIWIADPVPAALQSLAELEQASIGRDHGPSPQDLSTCDAVILLECPTADRSGLEDRLPDLPFLNIDHHLGNPNYGAENWVDVNAPAVGEMLWRLVVALEWQLAPRAAHLLFLALNSDTGGFRFSNATARAFGAAQALVTAGAQPEEVSHLLYERNPPQWAGLLARMLDTLVLAADGAIATVAVTREALASVGADRGHTEGLIDIPRSIAGVRAVALLRETDAGVFKVSLRSRGTVDVEQVARRNRGGGHRNAAGCTMVGTLAEARALVEQELIVAVRTATPSTTSDDEAAWAERNPLTGCR